MSYLLLLSMLAQDYPVTGVYADYPVTGIYAQPVALAGYPARGGRMVYVYVQGVPYLPSWQHLNEGEHKGQFDLAWLRSLSQEDLTWLHNHAHAGTVNWNYAKKPAQVTSAAKGRWETRKQCINGRCSLVKVWVND